MGLLISIRKFGGVTIVDLRGRSTFNDGERELLSSRLEGLVANGVRKLLLNLADLTQIDSSGVSIIVGTYVSLKREGGGLKLRERSVKRRGYEVGGIGIPRAAHRAK